MTRIVDGLTNARIGRKVDDGLHPVAGQLRRPLIQDVSLDELDTTVRQSQALGQSEALLL